MGRIAADPSYTTLRAGYTFAGFIATVGHPSAVAFASCMFLTSYPFGMLTLVRKSEINTGDIRTLASSAPHKLTPMLGVLADGSVEAAFWQWLLGCARR